MILKFDSIQASWESTGFHNHFNSITTLGGTSLLC